MSDRFMPIKWQPFKDLERPNNLPERLFGGDDMMPFMPGFKMEEPAVDIYQDKLNLYIETPLAGVSPENVEISIEDDILTIQGKGKEEKQIKERDYFRKEIRSGSFKRMVKLPVKVKGDKATAESSNGMLKITVPKAARSSAQVKRIPIKIK